MFYYIYRMCSVVRFIGFFPTIDRLTFFVSYLRLLCCIKSVDYEHFATRKYDASVNTSLTHFQYIDRRMWLTVAVVTLQS